MMPFNFVSDDSHRLYASLKSPCKCLNGPEDGHLLNGPKGVNGPKDIHSLC